MIERSWSATVETPDELSSAFLSHETVAHVAPPLTSSWAELGQAAETGPSHEVEIPLTSDLLSWAKDLPHHGPVHMLNLHAYSPGGRKKYMQYIQAFMEELGPKSGGVARFLGPIEGKEWDDIALVEYPNLQYFMELLASEDYQKMDQKYKIGSLRDGGILCVTKIEL